MDWTSVLREVTQSIGVLWATVAVIRLQNEKNRRH